VRTSFGSVRRIARPPAVNGRVADALDAGLPLTAGGLAIRLTDPNDVRTPPKQTVA
jgi:hypothetical protein